MILHTTTCNNSLPTLMLCVATFTQLSPAGNAFICFHAYTAVPLIGVIISTNFLFAIKDILVARYTPRLSKLHFLLGGLLHDCDCLLMDVSLSVWFRCFLAPIHFAHEADPNTFSLSPIAIIPLCRSSSTFLTPQRASQCCKQQM